MKKVLFYFRGIYNGGTEMESYTLLTKLKDSYDVYFTYYDEENSDKITIAKMESVAKYIPFNSKATFDTIVFCTQARREIEKIKEKFEYNSAYFWYHYYSENQNAFLEMALNGACDKVIAVSKTSKKKLENLDFAKGKEDRIVVINNIVDVDKIKAIADEKTEYDTTHSLNLVTVARIAPEKRFDRIINIANELERRNINYRWLIIGKVNKLNCTDYEKSIQDMFLKHKDIIFIGEKDNPFKYLKKADYSVLTSDRETWGLVITESKIVGTPCVVTNFDVVYEQIEDGKNGIILDMNNEDYETLVQRMLDEKDTLKNNLKSFNYDIETILNKWNEIL